MIRNSEEGRAFLRELKRQPEKFVFTNAYKKPIFWTVLALVTPMKRDDKTGKKPAQAHVLMEDLHGRGKTATLIHLSSALEAKIGQIEGKIDTMPRELIGGEEKDPLTGVRTILKGPMHSHVLSFDEITRAPAKTQTPLFGAMDGARVLMNVTNIKTGEIESKSFSLYPVPGDYKNRDFFSTIATANPIELEGTFPLSEAEKDRFTYRTSFGLPSEEDEMKIRSESFTNEHVERIGTLSDILDITEMVDQIKLKEDANILIQRLLDNSRPRSRDEEDFGGPRKRFGEPEMIEFVNKHVILGCSPRRNLHMQAAAKAYAWFTGQEEFAGVEHVQAIATVTMPHVLMLHPTLDDTVTPALIVKRILRNTWLPE